MNDPLRLALLILAATVLVSAAVLFAHDATQRELPWVNHDVAFHSWVGQEMIQGARLYVDVHDTNPPGSQFLQAFLLRFAMLFGLPGFLVVHLFVLGLGVAGLLLMHRALPGRDNTVTVALIGLAYLLVVVRGNFSNHLYPEGSGLPYDFGQREQLFALLFFPYLVWRWSGRPASWAHQLYLVLLGFVSMFKPYWPPLIVLVELFGTALPFRRALSSRIALAAGMGLPLVFLLAHSPTSFATFFTEVIPLHFGGGYDPYGGDPATFIASHLHRQMMLGAALFLVCWVVCIKRRLLDLHMLLVLLFIAVAGYLSVLHQGKFWSYHSMVFFGAVAVPSAMMLARIVQDLPRAAGRVLAGVAIVIGLGGLGLGIGNLQRMLASYPALGSYLVRTIEGHERVMFLSMSVDYVYAPLHARVRTVGPWSIHFMLPEILHERESPERNERLEAYAAEVTAAIDEGQPELLLFAPYRQALPAGMTLHGVLGRHGVVPRADYARVPDSAFVLDNPMLRGWVLYRRVTPGRDEPRE